MSIFRTILLLLLRYSALFLLATAKSAFSILTWPITNVILMACWPALHLLQLFVISRMSLLVTRCLFDSRLVSSLAISYLLCHGIAVLSGSSFCSLLASCSLTAYCNFSNLACLPVICQMQIHCCISQFIGLKVNPMTPLTATSVVNCQHVS